MMTRRARLQEATRSEIKAVARRQMAERGAATLSLRAIAAEMGLTAPALYRYYPSRDDLITALIVDGFDALGGVLEEARNALPPTAYSEQFTAMMLAYRAWALEHPADFTLNYGTPIPGYHAPDDPTDPAVRRSLTPLLTLLIAAWTAGAISPAEEYAAAPPALLENFTAMLDPADLNIVPATVIHVAFVAWARLQGLIMLELFGHITPVIADPELFYRFEITIQLRLLGLTPLP